LPSRLAFGPLGTGTDRQLLIYSFPRNGWSLRRELSRSHIEGVGTQNPKLGNPAQSNLCVLQQRCRGSRDPQCAHAAGCSRQIVRHFVSRHWVAGCLTQEGPVHIISTKQSIFSELPTANRFLKYSDGLIVSSQGSRYAFYDGSY
jgi:hypothetical protein